MNVKELMKRLDQYTDHVDIFVLERRQLNRTDGSGKLLKLSNIIRDTTDQDKNKISHYKET